MDGMISFCILTIHLQPSHLNIHSCSGIEMFSPRNFRIDSTFMCIYIVYDLQLIRVPPHTFKGAQHGKQASELSTEKTGQTI